MGESPIEEPPKLGAALGERHRVGLPQQGWHRLDLPQAETGGELRIKMGHLGGVFRTIESLV
jgi:hypothetical protein